MRIHESPQIDRLPAITIGDAAGQVFWQSPRVRAMLARWTCMRKDLARTGHGVYPPPALLCRFPEYCWAWGFQEDRLLVERAGKRWWVMAPMSDRAVYVPRRELVTKLQGWRREVRTLHVPDAQTQALLGIRQAGEFHYARPRGWRFVPDASS